MSPTNLKNIGRIRVAIAVGLVTICMARPLSAQSCTGDCKGQGRVDIADLITAVNISLGLLSLDTCPALGPGPVTISRLITAVNNSLCACQPCPTPRPTSSFTATARETATPSVTPTPTAIFSLWHEDEFELTTADCPGPLVEQLRQAFVGQSFDYTVEEQGGTVWFGDGTGNRIVGTIDAEGNVEVLETVRQSEGACVVTIEGRTTVNLRQSPTTATNVGHFTTQSCPNMFDCTIQITSRWTRTSTLRRAGSGVRNLLHALLSAIP